MQTVAVFAFTLPSSYLKKNPLSPKHIINGEFHFCWTYQDAMGVFFYVVKSQVKCG